jgi:hypothetical protein
MVQSASTLDRIATALLTRSALLKWLGLSSSGAWRHSLHVLTS